MLLEAIRIYSIEILEKTWKDYFQPAAIFVYQLFPMPQSAKPDFGIT